MESTDENRSNPDRIDFIHDVRSNQRAQYSTNKYKIIGFEDLTQLEKQIALCKYCCIKYLNAY